jgi:hypothetical protein
MKFGAAIFASLITFLTIQPTFSKNPMGNFSEKKECASMCDMKKKCGKETGKQSNDCSANGCNPFMPCAIGNFFLGENPYTLDNLILILSHKIILTNDKLISSYIGDCWHPPESHYS